MAMLASVLCGCVLSGCVLLWYYECVLCGQVWVLVCGCAGVYGLLC